MPKLTSGWLLLLLIVTGCASTGEPPASSPSQEPIRDSLIVPGQRIGPIYLGMPVGQLYTALGEPTRSGWYESDGGGMQYDYYDSGSRQMLYVRTAKSNERVVEIVAYSDTYATREGIKVGSTDLAVRAKLGKPQRAIGYPSSPELLDLCYPGGMRVFTRSGVAYGFGISRPGRIC